MFWFYTDSDKAEIKSWIRNSHSPFDQRIAYLEVSIREMQNMQSSEKIPDAIQQYIRHEINSQIFSLKSDFQAQLEKFETEITDRLQKDFQEKINTLQAEIATLKSEIDALKRKSISAAELQAEIATLKTEIANLKKIETSVSVPAQTEKNLPSDDSIQPPTKIETSTFSKKIEVATPLPKIEIKPPKILTPPTDSIEKIFYLKPNNKVFIPNDRENISLQIRKALNVDDMKKFLLLNNSDISKKFQKLLNVHFNSVKSFVDKLKLKNLDDEELSETVTSKYFKLFQQIIFDNLIVSIKRGLKNSDTFYTEFLSKLNTYLEQCGIYTVDAKSGGKVTDDDYKNMSPQIMKTSDKLLTEIISEIERLPYRINYLDEFGEQQFFQYNGVMILYKAV